MKRFITILMLFVLISTLFSGCFSSSGKSETTENTNTTTTEQTTAATTAATTTKKELYYPTEEEYIALLNEHFAGAEFLTITHEKEDSITLKMEYNYLSFNYMLFEDEEGRITKCTTTVLGDYSNGKSFGNVFSNAGAQGQIYICALAVEPSYILACLMSEKDYNKDDFESKLETVIGKMVNDGNKANVLLYDCDFSISIADNLTMMTGFLNWDGEKK